VTCNFAKLPKTQVERAMREDIRTLYVQRDPEFMRVLDNIKKLDAKLEQKFVKAADSSVSKRHASSVVSARVISARTDMLSRLMAAHGDRLPRLTVKAGRKEV
jgi:hypothetical protein